jgi:UDP-glucose 4-epimerase
MAEANTANMAPSELPRTVAITGISGNLGHTEAKIVGIDRRPFKDKPKDIEHAAIDIRKKKVEDVFRRGKVEALIHMGIMHDPRTPHAETHSFNVIGTHKILDVCVKFGVKKVVVLSSSNVYGPNPDNPNFLPEETPLMAAQRYSGVRDLIELDMYAQSFMWKHPEIETVILRPVHIIGPYIKNAPSNYLRLPRPVTVMGFDPMVQLIHEEDACRAMILALKPGVRGVYNINGPGEVPLSSALGELGRKPIPVPHFLVRTVLKSLFDARISSFPPEEIDHIQYLCNVDGSRAVRELGWRPRHSLKDTIRNVLPPDRRG